LIRANIFDMWKQTKTYISERSVKVRYILMITTMWSILAHGFAYFNLMPQHDGIMHTVKGHGGTAIAAGRFLLPILEKIRGTYTVPWLTGVFFTINVAVVVFILCEILDFETRISQTMIAGFLVANISITEISSTFEYALDSYTLSVVFSVLAAFMLIKKEIRIWPVASLILVASLGLYQAEIVFAVLTIVFYEIKEALGNGGTRELGKRVVRYVVSFTLAAIIYYGLYKLSLMLTTVQAANGYNSLSGLGKLNISNIVSNVTSNVACIFRMFFTNENIVGYKLVACNIVLWTGSCIGIIVALIKKKVSVINYIIIIIGVCVTPVFSVAMAIAMREPIPRLYVCYSIYMNYVLVVLFTKVIINNYNSKLITVWKNIFIAASVGAIMSNVLYSNNLYTQQRFMYDRSISVVTQVLYEINHTEGYIPGETPVILVLDDMVNNSNIPVYPVGISGMSANRRLVTTYGGSFRVFVNLLGQNIYIDEETVLDEDKTKQLAEMPTYPISGYVQKIDEAVVVKISERAFY